MLKLNSRIGGSFALSDDVTIEIVDIDRDGVTLQINSNYNIDLSLIVSPEKPTRKVGVGEILVNESRAYN